MKIILSCFFLMVICVCKCAAEDDYPYDNGDEYDDVHIHDCTGIINAEPLKKCLKKDPEYLNQIQRKFFPVNKQQPDVVNVEYHIVDGIVDENATHVVSYKFQWLDTILPLAVDPKLFTALTFNFVKLKVATVSLKIDSSTIGYSCEDEEKIKKLLQRLTSILKENTDGKIQEGYALRLKPHKNYDADGKEEKIKYIIAAWLFTTAMTFACILHCGRCNDFGKTLVKTIKYTMLLPLAFLISGKPKKMIKNWKEYFDDENKKGDEAKEHVVLICGRREEVIKTWKEFVDEKNKKIEEFKKCSSLVTNSKYNVIIAQNEAPSVNTMKPIVKKTSLLAKNKCKYFNCNDPFPFLKFSNYNNMLVLYPLCVVYVIFLSGVDIYFIIYYNYKKGWHNFWNSIDWLFIFPIPIYFSLAIVSNFVCYFISCCHNCGPKEDDEDKKGKKGKQDQVEKNKKDLYDKETPLCMRFIVYIWDFTVVLSVTTLPVFICFHGFWLFIATIAFPAQVASNAVAFSPAISASFIYIPYFTQLLCTLYQWCSACCCSSDKKVKCEYKRKIPNSLVPLIFLPFWVLLLTSLFYISNFFHRFNFVSENSWLVIIFSLFVIALAHKMAVLCMSSTKDEQKINDDNGAISSTKYKQKYKSNTIPSTKELTRGLMGRMNRS